jgi:(1->4)-alpha-D-glucan 1-alpha-D-glucosylmutase
MSSLSRQPVSTYRLQFHREFGFASAHAVVPYLSQLGITECYSSPQLMARPGSTHGYDICDHSQLNPDLGTDADYEAFTGALGAHGMGQILDIVPNHMSADPQTNPWWRDVLEHGPSSRFAGFFDIDWTPVKPELKGKVLLPMLGDQYGRVLDRGELQLRFARGELSLQYFDVNLPINPRQAPRILGIDLERLQAGRDDDPAVREYLSILTALRNLPPYTDHDRERAIERHREKEVTRERLARLAAESPIILEHIHQCVGRANGVPGDPSSFDLLHELLEHQAYRLAYWRTAVHEINYRRFFDINELVAVRMEEPRVFEETHALVRRLIERRQVTGLRVDHPDGLFDPQAYFERLQHLAAEAIGAPRPQPGDQPFYVVAEKILSEGEALSPSWPVSGTTGYNFLNQVSGLFIDGRSAKPLRRMYVRVTGRGEPFDELAYECKRVIMVSSMASELNVLAHALNRISESDRRWRDFTLEICRKALLEVIACFRVYRTYVSERSVSEFDRAAVSHAAADAERRNPLVENSIFTFLQHILLSPNDHPFAMKVQQFTGPVQAKGVEDTAFYRYNVIVSANDVGGHPQRLGVSPELFHETNRERLHRSPLEMTATSTHDAKRGEDARARINVLSELPEEWRRGVSDWIRMNAGNRTRIHGQWAPDRNDEYLFYQTLTGAWPAEPPDAPVPRQAPPDLGRRLIAYMQKAVREAKLHTSWVDEDPAYGEAVERFVDKTLHGRTAPRFLASFVQFQRRVAPVGIVNALSQLVLKLASPGVPDTYQGSELWNFDLVDPDNRRPVDYALRCRLLDSLQPLIDRVERGETAVEEVAALRRDWHDGRIKLFITACGLRFRRRHPSLLLYGEYLPLAGEGAAADAVVGFARSDAEHTLLALVPRLSARVTWGPTRISLPHSCAANRYRHLLTGEVLHTGVDGRSRFLVAADVFRTLPVALLKADSLSP